MASCLTDIINANKVDFIGLQETMKKNYKPSFFRRFDPHSEFRWEWIPSIGKSGGILCGSRLETLEVIDVVRGKFILQLNLFDKIKRCE